MSKYGTFIQNPASSKDIHLKGGNLYLKGFAHDRNGNAVIKLSYPNSQAFSIQIGQSGMTELDRLYTKHIHSDLNQSDLDLIADKVIWYIQNYGSTAQKKGLHLYKTNPKQSKNPIKYWIIDNDTQRVHLTITKGTLAHAEKIASDLNRKAGVEKYRVMGFGNENPKSAEHKALVKKHQADAREINKPAYGYEVTINGNYEGTVYNDDKEVVYRQIFAELGHTNFRLRRVKVVKSKMK